MKPSAYAVGGRPSPVTTTKGAPPMKAKNTAEEAAKQPA
jgi:hypothetical protein